jgi:GNAT superfamily N-acetyltransferase
MILRRATPADCPALVLMIHDHAAYERGVAVLSAQSLDDLLRQADPPVHLFVAQIDALAGYAAMTYDYALWQGKRTGQLDCLFVAEAYRGRGIGGELLHHCAQAAREAGAVWLEWQTPRWNVDAIGFYLRQGAKTLDKERFRFVL